MEGMPELPFEHILSYLSLEDSIRCRVLSKYWRDKLKNVKTETLCFSKHPSGFIEGKGRFIRGPFAQNFISSPQFQYFFNKFSQTTFPNLKRLHLCELNLDRETRDVLGQTINSFGQLEELGLFRFGVPLAPTIVLKLQLPMLQSIHIESVHEIGRITLTAPRLRKIKQLDCVFLWLDLVHKEPVETVLIDQLRQIKAGRLTNLRYLYTVTETGIPSTLLSELSHLKEVHLDNCEDAWRLFEQKQRYDRPDLKIYLWGLLLDGPNDVAIDLLFDHMCNESWHYLAQNQWKLADEIPLYEYLDYRSIEGVDPALENSFVRRFTDLNKLLVFEPVQDVQRFLNLLKRFPNIIALEFWSERQQELFDRLPEHSAVQNLTFDLDNAPSDTRFLLKLKSLVHLKLSWSIDTETIREVLEELPFLSLFELIEKIKIERDHRKRFKVSVGGKEAVHFTELNALLSYLDALLDSSVYFV